MATSPSLGLLEVLHRMSHKPEDESTSDRVRKWMVSVGTLLGGIGTLMGGAAALAAKLDVSFKIIILVIVF